MPTRNITYHISSIDFLNYTLSTQYSCLILLVVYVAQVEHLSVICKGPRFHPDNTKLKKKILLAAHKKVSVVRASFSRLACQSQSSIRAWIIFCSPKANPLNPKPVFVPPSPHVSSHRLPQALPRTAGASSQTELGTALLGSCKRSYTCCDFMSSTTACHWPVFNLLPLKRLL